MNLSKTRDFFTKNKKAIFILVVAIFALFPDFAFAELPNTIARPSDTWDTSWLISFLNWLFRVISGLLALLTQIVWMFITPEWVNGSVIGITEHIRNLWILVSNVVYFIFAFILITIAMMNIFGRGERWELKQALPKFIVWVLIVPFSWFFIQITISFTSVLSASVLSLPFDTLKWSNDTNTLLETTKICTNWEIKKDWTECASWENVPWPLVSDWYKSLSEIMTWEGQYGLLNIYTFSIFNADKYANLYNNQLRLKQVEDLLDLWIDKIFHLLFIVVYLILLFALTLALFVRVVWLWLYMVFSPVFGLLYFFDKSKDWFMDGKFSISQFLWLAMVPVYVSAALGFGLLFIFVAWQNFESTETDSLVIEFRDDRSNLDSSWTYVWPENGEVTKSYITLFPNADWWWYNVSYEWGNMWGIALWDLDGLLGWLKWTFWSLLLQLFGLWILWVAVISAANWSKVTQQVVQPFADFWKSIGDLVMKSPTYAPIIPTSSWMMSASSLQRAWSTFSWAVEWHFNQKWVAFWNKMAEGFWIWWSDLQEINNLINGTSKEALKWNKDAISKFYWKLNSTIDIDKLAINEEMKKKYLEALELSWAHIDDNERTIFMDSKNAWTLANAMKKIIDHESDTVVKAALQNTYWTTQADIKSYLWWIKSVSWAWDNSYLDISSEEYKNLDDDWKENKRYNMKIKRKENIEYWSWNVAIMTENKDWATQISVKFNHTKQDAKSMTWEDLKEAIELYEKLWSDSDKLEKVLGSDWLGFNNSEDLSNYIKDKYNEKNKKST